jgi:hypothetical protein
MAERVSLTDAPRIEEVAMFYSDTANSIRYYYASGSLAQLDPKFARYSPQDVQKERDERIETLDRVSAFDAFAAMEAQFKTDYYVRCQRKQKDPLSRAFRAIHKRKGNKISWEDDILNTWSAHIPSAKSVISNLKGAMLYRHWRAHGSYWIPRLGRKHDFASIYHLAQRIAKLLPLKSN